MSVSNCWFRPRGLRTTVSVDHCKVCIQQILQVGKYPGMLLLSKEYWEQGVANGSRLKHQIGTCKLIFSLKI